MDSTDTQFKRSWGGAPLLDECFYQKEIEKRLREIDRGFKLDFNPRAQKYVVQIIDPATGASELFGMYDELGQHIVERARRVRHQSYDLLDEIEAIDRQGLRDEAHEEAEFRGPIGEELGYLLKKEKQIVDHIYVP